MKHRQTLYFLAIVFVISGILLTLENLDLVGDVSNHWPFFLLVVGSGFVMLYFNRDSSDDVLMWLGSFIFLLGSLFYFLNFTDWAMLSRLWPLFLGGVGLSFLFTGVLSPRRLYLFFAVFFIGLFIIFTSVFTISAKLWPLSFVVFGLALIVLQFLLRRKRRDEIE